MNELDNRGSHFYLAMYWAQALADQKEDPQLSASFANLAAELSSKEMEIVSELNNAQGKPVDIDVYYNPDTDLASKAMRPSPTFVNVLS